MDAVAGLLALGSSFELVPITSEVVLSCWLVPAFGAFVLEATFLPGLATVPPACATVGLEAVVRGLSEAIFALDATPVHVVGLEMVAVDSELFVARASGVTVVLGRSVNSSVMLGIPFKKVSSETSVVLLWSSAVILDSSVAFGDWLVGEPIGFTFKTAHNIIQQTIHLTSFKRLSTS